MSAKLIVSLLEQNTSLQVVSDYLKDKKVPHSTSSWEALYESRLKPALAKGTLKTADLVELLRSTEESGRQHVFLYRCPAAKAAELLDKGRVERVLKRNDMQALLTSPRILDQPESATIVDVRFDGEGAKQSLVVKMVERREYREFLREEEIGNNQLLRRYQLIRERAVNVVRLNHDGSLDLRIASHKNSSRYKEDLQRIWRQVSELIPAGAFSEISLSRAKERLWKERDKLRDRIRFSDSTFSNDQGNVLKAATGSIEADLIADEGVSSSLDNFVTHDAHCDASNIWFKAGAGGVPARDLHILLSGDVNELAITARCSQADFEYALSELRALNR